MRYRNCKKMLEAGTDSVELVGVEYQTHIANANSPGSQPDSDSSRAGTRSLTLLGGRWQVDQDLIPGPLSIQERGLVAGAGAGQPGRPRLYVVPHQA
eukprot:COSAG05_NODE_3012_length_2416_cov_8.168680_3_plen_97_part_00